MRRRNDATGPLSENFRGCDKHSPSGFPEKAHDRGPLVPCVSYCGVAANYSWLNLARLSTNAVVPTILPAGDAVLAAGEVQALGRLGGAAISLLAMVARVRTEKRRSLGPLLLVRQDPCTFDLAGLWPTCLSRKQSEHEAEVDNLGANRARRSLVEEAKPGYMATD